jgi:hypothetical protein
MSQGWSSPGERRTNWQSVITVCSAAILIGAEVFGGAYAGGWAFGTLFNLGEYGVYILQGLFCLLGVYVMITFVRNAMTVESFTTKR